MTLTPNFYQDRLCLNVLAGSKENARAIWQAAEGHVLVGVLSKTTPATRPLLRICASTPR